MWNLGLYLESRDELDEGLRLAAEMTERARQVGAREVLVQAQLGVLGILFVPQQAEAQSMERRLIARV